MCLCWYILILNNLKYLIGIYIIAHIYTLKVAKLAKQIHNKLECSMHIYQRQKAYISQTIKIQEHARADHIWSSPLKERNTEDSLNHSPPPPQCRHTHALPCLSCPPSTPLLHSCHFWHDTNVFASLYMLRSSEHRVLLTRADWQKTSLDAYVLTILCVWMCLCCSWYL